VPFARTLAIGKLFLCTLSRSLFILGISFFPHSTQQADEDKNFRDTLISLTHPNRSIPTIFGDAATSVSAQHILRVKIKDFIFMNFADFFLSASVLQ